MLVYAEHKVCHGIKDQSTHIYYDNITY